MATGFWDQYRKKTTQPATQARPYPSSFSLSNQSGIPTRTGTQVTSGGGSSFNPRLTSRPQAPAPSPSTQPLPPPRNADGSVVWGAVDQSGMLKPTPPDERAWLQDALDFLQGGRRDTAADRAAIENRVNMQSREALMNNQASLGAAGFGQSGALVGLDAGIRADAAQRILEMQNQLERDADREYLDRIGSAMDYDLRERGMAQDEAAQSRLFDLISELYGDGGAVPAAPPGGATVRPPGVAPEYAASSSGADRSVAQYHRDLGTPTARSWAEAEAAGYRSFDGPNSTFTDENGVEYLVTVNDAGEYMLVPMQKAATLGGS